MFSSRTPADLAHNPLARAIAERRARGADLLDLTESNPTRAGLAYPRERILAALAPPGALVYEPDARGLGAARDAVATYYAGRGVAVDPNRVVLTASTSEAYALIFKVLADAGDEVLVPVPSYPLFEHLARAECVVPVAYSLEADAGWRVDLHEVDARVSERTRAVVVVSPNNPTGSVLTRREAAALVELCRERRLALVCDEVFADYVYAADPRHVASVAAEDGALTFTLNGLSKIAGLPQVKLGWIVANGPEALVGEALARLEFAADLFLSVATPVQHALAPLLALAPEVQAGIRERVGSNRAWLDARIGLDRATRALPAEAGWYALLRVPRIISEEALALALVVEDGVLVHPGYFFEFAREGLLVVSLLTEPGVFREGVERLVARVDGLA
jgi:alanine-synthesizing transaminase